MLQYTLERNNVKQQKNNFLFIYVVLPGWELMRQEFRKSTVK